MCLTGLQLNKDQLISLIHELGGAAPSPATKKELQLFIINGLLTGDASKACAEELEKQAAAKQWNDDDEIDSQLSEVLSELDKEDGNAQDLQEYTKKRHIQRMKRKLQTVDSEIQKKTKGQRQRQTKGVQRQEVEAQGQSSKGQGERKGQFRPWG